MAYLHLQPDFQQRAPRDYSRYPWFLGDGDSDGGGSGDGDSDGGGSGDGDSDGGGSGDGDSDSSGSDSSSGPDGDGGSDGDAGTDSYGGDYGGVSDADMAEAMGVADMGFDAGIAEQGAVDYTGGVSDADMAEAMGVADMGFDAGIAEQGAVDYTGGVSDADMAEAMGVADTGFDASIAAQGAVDYSGDTSGMQAAIPPLITNRNAAAVLIQNQIAAQIAAQNALANLNVNRTTQTQLPIQRQIPQTQFGFTADELAQIAQQAYRQALANGLTAAQAGNVAQQTASRAGQGENLSNAFTDAMNAYAVGGAGAAPDSFAPFTGQTPGETYDQTGDGISPLVFLGLGALALVFLSGDKRTSKSKSE